MPKRTDISSILIAVAVPLALIPAAAAPAEVYQWEPSNFAAATTRIGAWQAGVFTELDWRNDIPSITSVECRAASPDLAFKIDQRGGVSDLWINFFGPPGADGRRKPAALLGDVMWLEIDGRKVEVAYLRAPLSALSNFAYPESHETPESVPLPRRGYQGFRERSDGPWLVTTRLFDRVLRARHVYWRYKWLVSGRGAGNSPLPNWKTGRYPVALDGISQALRWCETQVGSPATAILPSGARGR